ncbi:hypothetical protein DPMN_040613 [Dreissena polymorpha]|uniref:Uncharacterized protein n=1 Tax=Dreissena polymorpha TaxID=45954 RepID=A0A9D4CVD4_DREPO|nr:hypothetical protein DPMN_040581 [Dreissena polymorpha]KAH3734173.1 hypothetical protein DPMN_040613 [Dreissena polymorpha]
MENFHVVSKMNVITPTCTTFKLMCRNALTKFNDDQTKIATLIDDNDHMEIIAAGDMIFDVSEEEEADQPEEEEIPTEEDIQEEVVDLVRERKCITFDRNLLKLKRLMVTSECDRKNCGSNVKMTTKLVGSSTKIQWVCSCCIIVYKFRDLSKRSFYLIIICRNKT